MGPFLSTLILTNFTPNWWFWAWETYEKQLRIEKTRLSHQVWSHRGSTFEKNMTLNGHFSCPAETDPYEVHITTPYHFMYAKIDAQII